MPEYIGTVIRPPSEADSLVLQYTIGCSHNRCVFCPAYKQKQFRIRSIREMETDIVSCLPSCRDARRIFLADGDALAAPQEGLLDLFALLHSYFPRFSRIGMYANAGSVLGKSVAELAQLREQGLGVLYLGVESGDDNVLAWMQKGVTSEEMLEAGRRVKESGIKFSVTVLLGIGGSTWSKQHAQATGRLLSKLKPDHVGALTTMVVPDTPLHLLEEAGDFSLPDPFSLLLELAEMIEHTEMRGLFFANHASNYLPLRVRMPMQRTAAVAMIRQCVHHADESLLKPEWLRGL